MEDLQQQQQQIDRPSAVAPARPERRPGGRRFNWLPPQLRLSFETGDRPREALRRDAIFRRALVASDVAAAGLSLLVVELTAGQGGSLAWASLGALVLVVFMAKLLGLYDRDELVFHKSTLDEAPAVFHLASLFALLSSILGGVLFHDGLTRIGVLELWLAFFVLALGGRIVARVSARAIAPAERCLVVGAAGSRARFALKLERTQRRTEVVGFLPLRDERRRRSPGRRFERRRESLTLADLEECVAERDVHRVVIVPGDADSDAMLEAVSRAKAAGVKVSILPRMFEVVGSSVEFDDLEGLTVLGVRPFGLSRSSRLIKRALDLTISGLALLVLSPLLALLALAIRLDSPGPVLFRQQRVGQDGETFEMLKFRSMVEGAERDRDTLRGLNESDGLFKIASDPRLTRVGRLMRPMSLDELPQFINVLCGRMSLVGPRPLVLDEDRQIEGHHRGRLKLTPGMTGPWQLLGPTRVPLADMVKIDYVYGANWSLWADVKILLRTVAHVFSRQGL